MHLTHFFFISLAIIFDDNTFYFRFLSKMSIKRIVQDNFPQYLQNVPDSYIWHDFEQEAKCKSNEQILSLI